MKQYLLLLSCCLILSAEAFLSSSSSSSSLSWQKSKTMTYVAHQLPSQMNPLNRRTSSASSWSSSTSCSTSSSSSLGAKFFDADDHDDETTQRKRMDSHNNNKQQQQQNNRQQKPSFFSSNHRRRQASCPSPSLSLSSSTSLTSNRNFGIGLPTSAVSSTLLAIVAVAVTATAGSFFFPSIAHAVSSSAVESSSSTLASLVGGASTIAADANVWMTRISETGFYQAFSLVFLSEIGDKTFFIAGLLAMKTSRFISFLGSIGALAAMTVISVIIGQLFHAVPSGLVGEGVPLDDIAAIIAFAFFGLKTLKEALFEDADGVMDEELAEAEEAVEGSRTIKEVTAWGQLISIFTLVFAAEFGDRSFLSTIALSAAQNPISVAGGAIAAHAAATGIAVSGGAVLAKYISEKVIGIISGTLFLVFAATTAFGVF